jgi:hypothetical protein
MRGLRYLAAFGLLSASTIASAATVADTDNDATVDLIAGTVTVNITTDLAFADQTVTGNDIVLTNAATVPSITVNDARGTGTGWTLSLQASSFSDGTHSFDASNFTYVNPTANPMGSVDWPGADPSIDRYDDGQGLATAVNLLTSGTDEGMGNGTFGLDVGMFGLTIPATQKAGNYHSDLTATVTYTPVQ